MKVIEFYLIKFNDEKYIIKFNLVNVLYQVGAFETGAQSARLPSVQAQR